MLRPRRRNRERRTKTARDILGDDRSLDNILAHADELAEHFGDHTPTHVIDCATGQQATYLDWQRTEHGDGND